MDGGVDGVETKIEIAEPRDQIEADAGMGSRNRGRRGASQRAPNVGSTARFSVPPNGLARRLREAVLISLSASRISRA